MDSVGDLARQLVLRTNQVRLRTEMDQLAVEVATGFVKDPASHLKGDLTGLMAIDRTLSKLDTYRVNTAEATYLTGAMQTSLDEIQGRSETLSQSLIAAELTPNDSLLQTMSRDAEDALSQVLGTLNRTVAGRFLFSGVATDRAAVPDIETFMTQLRMAVAGQSTLADIETQLDAFFATGGTTKP